VQLSGVPPENSVRRDAEPHTRGRVCSPEASGAANISETSYGNRAKDIFRDDAQWQFLGRRIKLPPQAPICGQASAGFGGKPTGSRTSPYIQLLADPIPLDSCAFKASSACANLLCALDAAWPIPRRSSLFGRGVRGPGGVPRVLGGWRARQEGRRCLPVRGGGGRGRSSV
jgi:hypothetical protein